MMSLDNFDSDYLRECRASWLALSDRSAEALAIETELRDRGEEIDLAARRQVEGRRIDGRQAAQPAVDWSTVD